MGFALFSTAQFALAAKDTLQVSLLLIIVDLNPFYLHLITYTVFGMQHLVFDAESKSVIHTEMAKKNLFVKRGQLYLYDIKGLYFFYLSTSHVTEACLIVDTVLCIYMRISLRSLLLSSFLLQLVIFTFELDCYCVGIVGDSNAYDQSKRLRTGGDCTHSVYSPSPFHPPPPPVWGPPHGSGICFSFIFQMLCRNWTMCILYIVFC